MKGKEQNPLQHPHAFWIRLTLTSVLVTFPLAWGFVVFRVSPVVVGTLAAASGAAMVLIWGGSRLLPSGLVFWARPEPMLDGVTGLLNPDAWTKALASEESRAARHRWPASIVSISVAPVDEGTARRVGAALRRSCREHDVVACLGNDRFAILAMNCPRRDVDVLVARVRDSLGAAGVVAAFGVAERSETDTLLAAWARAEAARVEPGKSVPSEPGSIIPRTTV